MERVDTMTPDWGSAADGPPDAGAPAWQTLMGAWTKALGGEADAGPAAQPAGPPATLPAALAHHAADGMHVVRPGETLSQIAHRYGLDWNGLARANHIADPTRMRAGTVLRIPRHGGVPGHHAAHHRDAAGPQHRGGSRLGDLSMRFETGYSPGQEAAASGEVSSGRNDPGGVSYGAFQLTSSAAGGDQVDAFLKSEGAPWADAFKGQDAGQPNGAFAATWKAIAARDPQAFFAAQHAYIQRTHDAPVVAAVKARTGVDISSRSGAVQNAVWSMSVQHGRAARLVENAVQRVGPQGAMSDTEYDRKLINALYDVRDDYVDAIGQPDLKTRYKAERADALRMLDRAP